MEDIAFPKFSMRWVLIVSSVIFKHLQCFSCSFKIALVANIVIIKDAQRCSKYVSSIIAKYPTKFYRSFHSSCKIEHIRRTKNWLGLSTLNCTDKATLNRRRYRMESQWRLSFIRYEPTSKVAPADFFCWRRLKSAFSFSVPSWKFESISSRSSACNMDLGYIFRRER